MTGERFTFGTALYHPHIDIDDSRWLRSAVLFWDHIQTIVPASIEQPYKNPDTQILAAEGLLSPIPPNAYPDILDDLERRVLKFSESAGKSLGHYKISGPGGRAALLHPDKLGMSLRYELERGRQGRGRSSPLRRLFGDATPDDQGFLHVDSDFAESYMSILAAGLAEKTGSSPLSNEGRAFSDNLRATVADLASHDERETADGTLVRIAMESLVIDPSIPIDHLVRFKSRHADELEQLAVEFDKLAAQIKGAESLADLEIKARRIYRRDVRPRLEGLQKSLGDQSIGSVFGGITLAATASVGAAAPLSTLLGFTGSVLLGTGAFLTIGKFALDATLARKKARRDSPFTYLADVRRTFELPPHLVEN